MKLEGARARDFGHTGKRDRKFKFATNALGVLQENIFCGMVEMFGMVGVVIYLSI